MSVEREIKSYENRIDLNEAFIVKSQITGGDRMIFMFPKLKTTAVELFGEDPKVKLAELSQTFSDTEIAELVSLGDFQVSTFAIRYLRLRYRIRNDHYSPRRKFKLEEWRLADEIREEGLLTSLPIEEAVALSLGNLYSHKATTAEIKRLLGMSSIKKTKVLQERAVVSAKRLLENSAVD